VVNAGKPLFDRCRRRRREALATLVINRLRGTFQVCAVKAAGYGEQSHARRNCLPDRRATDLPKAWGSSLESLSPGRSGRAKKIIVDKDNTTIIEGPASSRKSRLASTRFAVRLAFDQRLR